MDDSVGARCDARERAVEAVRHPDRFVADGDARRPTPDVDRLADVVRLRVDAGDRILVAVGHPERAGAGRDRARRVPDRDLRRDLAALRVDEPDVVRRDRARRARAAAREDDGKDDGGDHRGRGRPGKDAPVLPPRPAHLLDRVLRRLDELPFAAGGKRGRARLQGREVGPEAGRGELVDALRLVQVLELVLAEIA